MIWAGLISETDEAHRENKDRDSDNKRDNRVDTEPLSDCCSCRALLPNLRIATPSRELRFSNRWQQTLLTILCSQAPEEASLSSEVPGPPSAKPNQGAERDQQMQKRKASLLWVWG